MFALNQGHSKGPQDDLIAKLVNEDNENVNEKES